MTHETLERRREELKLRDVDAFVEFKARRYAMFRIQTFLEGGSAPEAEHMAMGKEVEQQVVSLGGLAGFAKEWDLDALTGKVVARDRSVWDVHEAFMQRVAVPLTLGGRNGGSQSNI
jgi:hypothetical protein